jgi:hypothetical protein
VTKLKLKLNVNKPASNEKKESPGNQEQKIEVKQEVVVEEKPQEESIKLPLKSLESKKSGIENKVNNDVSLNH